MSVVRTIKTTGDLRNMLADTLVKVEARTMPIDEARMIHKLAHAINDSFFGEAKLQQIQHDLSLSVSSLGETPLSKPQTMLAKAA